MSLKNLFSKISSKHILPESSVNDLLEDIESGRYIDEYIKRKARFLPHIDYATASNFARFGLAEEYYDSAARRIYQTYPYDGSSYEKIKWINNSNGLDLYVFDNEYPRTHGHARFSPTGWGSRTSLSGNYGNPATKEYIYIKGGPNVDNIWHTASNRTSNLEIDGNKGNTVEFWLKKSAFQTLTKREVVFDAWTTGSVPSGHQYGRLTIELDRTRPQEDSPWVVTYQSASSGVKNLYVSGTAGLYASASDGEWHHYAFSFQNTGSQVNFRLHVDGDLNHSVLTGSSIGNLNTAIVANIGALVAAKDSDPQPRLGPSTTTNPGLGFGKLSGSIDEFRFWKAKRSSKDIGRYWFTQVHGGTNTDDPNTDLGVYYKFNEGITLTSSIDQIALDYSGRISNGSWTGYSSDSRSTKSAMIQSSASLTEFAEPIIHTENPKVNEYLDDILEKGRNYDINNNSSIYKSVPGWILEEDDEGELKQLTQIMGAYFDELFMQIQSLSKLKHVKSENYSKKPLPFMDKVLRSMGFETPEIFIDADVLASLASRDEEKEFEQRLEDVKNVIYQNIYNNLIHIYKSKGTEKAFRNLLRCYGIDEEVIKINVYADGVDYPVEQNYRVGSFKTRCINFNRPANFSSTIYQYSSSLHHSGKSSEFPVSGYITGAHANDSAVGLSFTTEAEVVFPIRHRAGTVLHFDTPISSSLFGAHTVLDSHGDTHDLTWKAAAKDFANFEVYAVKDREDSRHAKFVVKSTSGIVAPVETGIYYDVYDGNKWNFAVRVAPKGTFGNTISGSTNSYNLELFGVKTDAGEVKEEFLLTSSLTNAQGQRFHQYSKRLYAGAHRRNFTGSTIDLSDVQLSSLRHWMSYLDNETIRSHALDPKSYGVPHPMRNAYTFMPGLDNPVPTIETLALDWGFNTVTGSTKGGQLIIRDFSSGSLKNKRDYGWIGDVISSNHPGRGNFFPSETTASVSVAYLQTARQQILENVHSSDMIRVLTRDDTTYTRESRPVNHFFSIEKSMYQAISEEMLDMFATIKDFSNLIGDPVNRYRPNYKAMEKLRSLFFERVENTPSIEKYIEFYKWIDASISQVLDQLKPASANFSEDVRTMIESHVLERNKYWTKFPTLEGKQAEPEPGQIKSVNEMLYNWRYGHAPLPSATGPVAATATITITAYTELNAGDKVNLVAADGTSYDFEQGDQSSVNGTFEATTSNEQTATNLMNVINTSSGPAGARFTATVDGAVVTVTQATPGSAGNTSVTLTDSGTAGMTKANFTGGTDNNRSETENCLWWSERASRKDAPLTTGIAATDAERETLRRVAIADVSGSTYALRRLTKPYRFKLELQPVLHGGDNFHLNKKKDLYLGTSNPGALDFIRISGSDVTFAGGECTDVYNPRINLGAPYSTTTTGEAGGGTVIEKKKAFAKADISNTNSDHDLSTIAPFSLYSSSIDDPKDYKAEIYDNFKKGVDITNLHSDAYGDDREIPIQSPFTEHWVGGHSHRHQHLNMMRPKIPQADPGLQNITMSLDHAGRRFEGFNLTMSQGQLYVTSPNLYALNHEPPGTFNVSLTSSTHNRSRILREPLAKRPVNIRNIKTTASEYAKDTVLNIGNYKHPYEIVQGTSVEMSPAFLIDNHNTLFGARTEYSSSFDTAPYSNPPSGWLTSGTPGIKQHADDASLKILAFTGSGTAYSSITDPPVDSGYYRWAQLDKRFNGQLTINYKFIMASSTTSHLGYKYGLTNAPEAGDSNPESLYLQYQLGHTGSWVTLQQLYVKSEYGTGFTPATASTISGDNIALRWITRMLSNGDYDHWGVDEVKITSKGTIEQKFPSQYFVEIDDRVRPHRAARKNVFVNRFSAPGGPETAGDAHGGPGLDIATNQYSVYNSLNYRNMMPRMALDEWSMDRAGKFGHVSNSSITASSPTASYHKVYHNPRYVATASWESGVECRIKHDNQFVQHQIPQSDLGYAWIKNSTTETTCSYARLESKFTYPKAQSDQTVYETNEANAVDFDSPGFVSASDMGFGHYGANGRVLTTRPDVLGGGSSLVGFEPVDFAGLNFIVVEPISSSYNLLGYDDVSVKSVGGVYSRVNYLAARDDGARFRSNVAHGTLSPDVFKWDAHLLNAILSNRNGPYGYPSWKQLRAGQHPVARKLRRDNIMAPIVERDNALVNSFSPAYFTRGDYSWPDNIDHQRARTSRTISAQRYRFTESAVTSKFGPLKTTMIGKSVAGLANSYGSWRDAHSAGGTQISVGGKVTHGNDLVTFSNPELVNFLQIDEKASATPLRDKIGADIIQSLYSETIYPRDSNSYSNRVRGRENFIIDWWKPKRADRRTIDKHNSQGLHIGLTSSMWPLDAQTNFGTSNEIALGTDIPGAFGEGELMSSYCLFRSGGVGLGAYPTASAMYARKFPEENYIFNLTFNTTVTEKYWGGASDGDHTSYYIQFYPPEASAVVHYIYFCRTAETASVNNAADIAVGANKIWIPLSESSYTTTTLASAVKDGLNSNSIFKKVAKAESSTNKLSLHFKGTWDNSYVGGDYLADEYSDFTIDGQIMIGYLDTSPVFLSASSNTSTYLAGAAKWEAGEMAGRDPFNYKDYDDYAMQMRLIGKDYSIVPEYRISEEMPNYIGRAAADPYFSCPQADFLQMTGALDDFADSSKSDFFKVYGHSDFIKYFDIVKEGHKELAMSENSLTLRCKAMKKFLPYEGIYPAQRTLQLATMFSESYGPQTNVAVEKFGQTKGGYEPYGSWRTALQPFYAPGIAYNSIKSGIAVDYPVFTPNRDRKFNLFCTTFDKQDNNHINIGQASEWAQLISGSHGKNSSAANSGLSISMWVYFDEDPDADGNTDTSGSLLVFKDDDNATEGIHFTKHGGRLMLSMYTDASNYKKWWTKPYKSLTTADKWYHVAVAKKFDTSTPDFYIDGVQIETQGAATAAGITGTAGSLTETSVNMDGHSTTATGNCTIGNHRYGHTNTNHALNAMEVAISEVSIFNTKLTDESVRGLFGGGVRQRGPWRPDLCVEQPHVDNLIGWFRMGNDTGYVMAGTSGSITMTNNLGLNNHAMPLYRKTLVGGGKGSLAGVETTTKGKFVGFTDAWSAGAQTGYGITLLGENGVDTNMELTGAFQYPSYITGSAFNETSDFGIPRIGSASWGEHQAKGADPELAEATSYWTQGDYGRNFGTWGVQRVERLPFEVIIDPTRLVTNTVKNIGTARNVARLDERFTFYEMEPHPSASLQPCSFLRSRSSGSADTGARHLPHLSTVVPETYWGATHQTPITSSMLTASFSLSRMRVLSDTTYSKAANNFFAESSRFFLEGGHTTTIASEDTLQTAVDPSKTYKFRLRLNRPNTQDFPMYNRAAAFGPPINAGPGDHGLNRSQNYVGHGFAPYTPPHYDNYAEVEYIFNPSVGVSYETIEDVLNRITEQNSLGTATINYNRYIQGTGSKNNFGISGITNSDYVSGPGISTDFQSINAATASLNKTHAMQLSASFYGMDLAQGSLVPIFEGTERDRDILRKSWVIQSKWETPNMDFRKTTPAKAKPHYITTAKGMWHQTGAYDDPSSFIEIMPPIDGSEDLSSLLGVHFRKGERKIKEQRALSIGQLPEERKVSEAVVAIPFVEDESGNRKFFNIPKNEVYKAVQNEGYPNYKKAYIDTVEGRRLRHGRGRNKGTTTEVVANPISSRTSIQTMVGKMLKYVIPPKMNFLKYNNEEEKFVHPFAMYIFEFEHTLSKSDLAYMWQNLPPDVALNDFHNNDDDTLQAESVVSHDLGGATDLLGGSFNKNVKWMVFKVKQRAETNYFKKISRDKLPVGHPERELSVENDIFEYGYNWPYDYFSLVELVKIDAGVSFAKDRDIVEPLTPEQAEQTARAVAGLVPQENEEGEQEVDFKNLFPKEDE